MSKELKALEALQDLSKLVFIHGGIEQYKIIEKALKALEVIKETPEFAWYITIYDNAYEMVSDVKGFRVNNTVEELQEMFDLLKEVLL